MRELSPPGGSEGYGARDDEGAHAAQDAETFIHWDHFRFVGKSEIRNEELGIRNLWGPRRSPAAAAAGSVGRVGAAE